jgi:hypothetical protein
MCFHIGITIFYTSFVCSGAQGSWKEVEMLFEVPIGKRPTASLLSAVARSRQASEADKRGNTGGEFGKAQNLGSRRLLHFCKARKITGLSEVLLAAPEILPLPKRVLNIGAHDIRHVKLEFGGAANGASVHRA